MASMMKRVLGQYLGGLAVIYAWDDLLVVFYNRGFLEQQR